jgi:bacteriocin-like protein
VNNDIHELSTDELNAVVGGDKKPAPTKGSAIFEVKDFSFDIEQTLNIGSQSSGAGAGKVTFNPF